MTKSKTARKEIEGRLKHFRMLLKTCSEEDKKWIQDQIDFLEIQLNGSNL